MKKNRLSTLCSIALLLAVAIYVAYQVFANLTQQLRTVDALEVTVEETLSARGWFIRQQLPVTGGQGEAEYLVEDGEKVSKNQRIAVLFTDETAHQAFDRAAQLENRLEAAEYAYSMLTSGVDSVKMDELIFDSIRELDARLEQGQVWRLGSDYSTLQQLVVSRGAADADRAAFEEQLAQLKGELRTAQKEYASGSSSIRAKDAGYFVSGLDGYETVLTVDRLDTLTPGELDDLSPEPAEGVGSLTQGFQWYFAVSLTEAQAERLRGSTQAELYFPELSAQKLTLEVERLETYADGRAILILRSTRMEALWLTAREQDVDIVLGSYTGLKVPSGALRQKDGQWGVYVLESSVTTFKPVNWSYSTDSYYLVPCAPSPSGGLYRYDRMIVQGKDLVDGQMR